MREHPGLLGVLALADSSFPTGGFAFSSGLEGAWRAGHVRGEEDVSLFLTEQLRWRWHTADRVFLRMYQRDPRPERALEVDALAESCSVVDVLRRGSQRAGLALLGTFGALGSRPASTLRQQVLDRRTPGHLVTAQGVCLVDAGLSREDLEAVTCWNVVSQLASAALRLGIVGHLGAQRIVRTAVADAEDLLACEPPDAPATCTPLADVLAARRGGDGHLFAT